eukprot:SM000090S24346  [mRNA]  locus=s90:406268:408817:+ [translate_table: standard]
MPEVPPGRGLREPWEADEEDAWEEDDEAESFAGDGDGSGGGGGERSRALERLLAAFGDPDRPEEDDEPYDSVPGPPLPAEVSMSRKRGELTRFANLVPNKHVFCPLYAALAMLPDIHASRRLLPPDADMNDKVMALAYALKDCLPGRILSECTDASGDLFAMGFFDSAVEYQDPFICFRGAHRYREWLASIARLGASEFFLEEIYYELLAEHRYGNGKDSATWYWQAGDGEKQPAAGESVEGGTARMNTAVDMRKDYRGASEGDRGGVVEEESAAVAEAGHEVLQLTGDSKYEMARSGKVTSITSGWYVLEGDGAAQLAKAHLYLVALARYCERLPVSLL